MRSAALEEGGKNTHLTHTSSLLDKDYPLALTKKAHSSTGIYMCACTERHTHEWPTTCVRTCMHTNQSINTHTHTHTHTQKHKHIHTHTHTHTHTQRDRETHTHTSINTYTHTHRQTHTHRETERHTHTHTHGVFTHTHTHTKRTLEYNR